MSGGIIRSLAGPLGWCGLNKCLEWSTGGSQGGSGCRMRMWPDGAKGVGGVQPAIWAAEAPDGPAVCYCTSVELPYCLLLLLVLVTWAHWLWLCTELEALHPHSAVDYCSVQHSEYFVKWRWCWDKFNHVLMELWPHLYCGAKTGSVVDTCAATVVTSFKIMWSEQSTVCGYVQNLKMFFLLYIAKLMCLHWQS